MPLCPFAQQMPITGPSGVHLGGPFKIVHHTTEGSTASGAFAAFAANHSDPHFTVDGATIFQHVSTNVAARSLRNAPGGVQTNRDSAIQIEVVGFAHKPKDVALLRNVARLCRWIEAEHGVPKTWPNGLPKAAVNGHDPGGHNRDATNWDTKGGHYGHSQVPENTHWDPGYTADEVQFLMEFEENEMIQEPLLARLDVLARGSASEHDPVSTMPDHHQVEVDPLPRQHRKQQPLPRPPAPAPFLLGAGLLAAGVYLVWHSLSEDQ